MTFPPKLQRPIKSKSTKWAFFAEKWSFRAVWDDNHNNNNLSYGKITYANGDTYKGYIQNNKKHGKGLFKHENGSIFIGNFRDDYRIGKCIIIKNGRILSGDYNGRGELYDHNDL